MYFITTVHIENGEIIRQRCVGYFNDLSNAINVVMKNRYDIHENGYYNHAVIEEVKEGIYQHDLNPIWYEWVDEIIPGFLISPNERGYWRVHTPPEVKNLVGFCFG